MAKLLDKRIKMLFSVIAVLVSFTFALSPSLKEKVLKFDQQNRAGYSNILKSENCDTVYVVGVSDGDTFRAVTKDNHQIKYRIYGIDAPETKQAFGNKSKEALAKYIFNKSVLIKIENTDRYSRKVARVYLDGQDIGLQMIADGFAWHYKRYCNSEEYASAQISAIERKTGLWADNNPIAPWLWRKNNKRKKVK